MVYSKRKSVRKEDPPAEDEEEEEEEEEVQIDPGPSQPPALNPGQRVGPNGRVQEVFTFQALDWKSMLSRFWVEQKARATRISADEMRERCKHMALPMARVKKIMRIDDDVRSLMVAGDAPFFLAAAGEMFIEEVTSLAWQIVDVTRRRTMQKSDIVTSLQKVEQFDFLIDIIPRDRSIRQSYTIPHPKDYQKPVESEQQQQSQQTLPPPQIQQIQQLPLPPPQPQQMNMPMNHDPLTDGVHYDPQMIGDCHPAHDDYMMRQDVNGYERVTTITVDEHGNPIENVPPAYQMIVENGQQHHHQMDQNTYTEMQNGHSNETGDAQVYTYNGQTYQIVHIANGSETPNQYHSQ